jgi:hypothetical protein
MSNANYQRNAPTIGGAADLDASAKADGYVLAWDESEKRHVYVQQGVDPSTDARITTLENTNVRSTRFATISSGTSGTVTIPTNSSVILDDFGGTTDAVVSELSGGRPAFVQVYTTTGGLVAATFDTNGAYTLSGTPATYPICIIYRVRQSLINFDDTDADIVGEVQYYNDPIQANATLLGLTNEGPIQTSTLSDVVQAIGHSVWESGRSGWTEWLGSGNYWGWAAGNPGTFTLLRGGEGYIRGKEVYFSAGQTVTIAYNERVFVYIDEAGVLRKSSTNTAQNKKDRINLFVAQNDVNGEFIVINNVHQYHTDIGARQWIDSAHGTVVDPEGSLLSRYGTGTGASTTDRQVNISSGTIIEVDIEESWLASTTGVNMSHTYVNASGYFARDSYSKSFPMKYSNAGVPTAITTNSYGIFRVYVTKSDLNTAPPQIISEMNSAQYGNQAQADTVVANNTATNFGRLDKEIAQIAQVVVRNTAAGGHVVSITTAKKTVGAIIGSSGVGSSANLVATDTSSFDKVISSAATTVQAALNEIDENAVSVDKVQTISGAKTFSSVVTAPVFFETPTVITSDTTLSATTGELVLINSTSNSVAITLPSSSTVPIGTRFNFKVVQHFYAITIFRNSGDVFEGYGTSSNGLSMSYRGSLSVVNGRSGYWFVDDAEWVNPRAITASANMNNGDDYVNIIPVSSAITYTVTGNGAAGKKISISRDPTNGTAQLVKIVESAGNLIGGSTEVYLDPGQTVTIISRGGSYDVLDSTGGITVKQCAEKTTPVSADLIGLVDSSANFVLKKVTWGNILATIQSAANTFTGATSVKLDSTSAFTVEKADGTDVLKIDTTNSKAVITGNIEVSGVLVLPATSSFVESSTNSTSLSSAVSNSGVYFDIISSGTNAVGCTLTEGTWKIDCDFSVTAGVSAGHTSVFGALTDSSNNILARASVGYFSINATLANGASCSHIITVTSGNTLAVKLRGMQLWDSGAETFSAVPTFVSNFNRLTALRVR